MSDNKASKLDMDLINMVQNARMMHDKDAVPSKVPGVYWIESKNPAPKNKPTACTGEFQIQTTVDAVDEHWQMIKKATEKGYNLQLPHGVMSNTYFNTQEILINDLQVS